MRRSHALAAAGFFASSVARADAPEVPSPDVPPAAAPASAGRVAAPISAANGALGIRVAIIGNQVPLYSPVAGAAANAPVPVGTIGVSYFVSDALALQGDVGLGVALAGGEPRLGFKLSAGADYHFRTPAEALRPLLYAQLAIGRGPPNDAKNDGQDLPSLEAQIGGGAEYFFERHFSVTGRVGLGAAWRFGLGATAPGGGVISISTVVPGLGAAW